MNRYIYIFIVLLPSSVNVTYLIDSCFAKKPLPPNLALVRSEKLFDDEVRVMIINKCAQGSRRLICSSRCGKVSGELLTEHAS